MVSSRALTTTIGGALRSRRGRDVALLTAALLAASVYPIQLAVQSFVAETGIEGVTTLGRIVAWTPFGWPLAAVLDAGEGRWATAGLRLAGAVLLIVAVLAAWSRAVVRTLESPALSGSTASTGAGDLAPRWARRFLPTGRTGAVAAKELRYWWRDPRRRAAALTALLIGVGCTIAPAISSGEGIGRRLAFAGIGPAVFATMNSANQFGLDGTAVWIDVAVPNVAGHQVRGRQLAVTLLVVPIVARRPDRRDHHHRRLAGCRGAGQVRRRGPRALPGGAGLRPGDHVRDRRARAVRGAGEPVEPVRQRHRRGGSPRSSTSSAASCPSSCCWRRSPRS